MKHLLCIAPIAALLGAGCIHTNDTIVKDEARVPVEFENDAAGRIFYEAFSRLEDAGRKTEKHTKVSLPVVFHHEQTVVRGPNTAFNNAVHGCDTNQDGRITESEARIYAATVGK